MMIKRAIVGILFAGSAVSALLQGFIETSSENIACACIVLASSWAMLGYVSLSKALDLQPISTFAIVGFCLTTQLGALLVQTAFWTPLGAFLYNPLYTFSALAVYQAIAIAVHAAYRLFTESASQSREFVRPAFRLIGLYRIPSVGALWVMGGVGLSSYYVSTFPAPLGKLGDALNFLTWAPFLIPIYANRGGDDYCRMQVQMPCLIVHAAAVSLLALGLNIRVIMFGGVITVALNYLLVGLRSTDRVSWVGIRKLVILGVVIAAISGPLSYLTAAMAIAHASRGKVAADVMIEKTIGILSRPQLVEAFRAQEKKALTLYSRYDENYIANPLVARFIETKFHDNAFYFGSLLTTADSKQRMRDFTLNSLWASLPEPVLKLLGLNVVKNTKGVRSASTGDFLAYLARGIPVGSFVTGSAFAQGQVLLGGAFPFVYALICLVMYAVLDLLTVKGGATGSFPTALAMMDSWKLFLYGITAEGLDHLFIFVTRDAIQMIAVYCSVYACARVLLRTRDSGRAVSPLNQPRSLA